MSHVTNVVLLAGVYVLVDDDDKPTDAFAIVQERLEREHHQRFVVVPKESVGGSKNLEGDVAIAAFNYVDADAIIAVLRSAPWQEEDLVQVAIMGQHEYSWTLHHVFGEK